VEQLDISLVECQLCLIEFCVQLEKVDQKSYNSSIKPMEIMQLDELQFSSGENALEKEKRT
jgi:hypothetical protein